MAATCKSKDKITARQTVRGMRLTSDVKCAVFRQVIVTRAYWLFEATRRARGKIPLETAPPGF
jgi:hypothetical protein